LANRWLVEHRSSSEEISNLVAIVDRDLDDSATERLSPDWRLGICWNAVLHLAMLALAAEGYRPSRERSHERAVASLRYSVGLTQERVDLLDALRRRRNRSNYDRAGTVSRSEAREMFDLAVELRREVLEWLAANHPGLAPEPRRGSPSS
jgi:inactivated superfamily I helicase